MAKGKLKMLHLVRIFQQETDDEHALTLQQIIDRLNAVGITADRKTLYADFEELRQFGFDILSEQRARNTYYYLGQREFELPELKLLVDCVQAAKFITTRKSRELIRKLEARASRYQAEQLHRQVYISGRVKSMNESIYYNIDKLHEAINAGCQINFQYGQWNVKKQMELRRNGATYLASPWALAWADEKYYLVGYDADTDTIKHYRVDKMKGIRVLEAPRLGKERFRTFDMARYARSVFGMYAGEEAAVTLEADNDMVGVLIDRFGRDIPIVTQDFNRFQATVNVVVSPQFLGWLFALAPSVRVVAPDDIVQQMRAAIRRTGETYR